VNAAWLAIATFAAFALAYRFYSKFLAERVSALRDDETVPAR
jgi:carbon starvation protein